MNNREIARVFQTMADLLELKGENKFKIRAYQKASRSIENLTVEAEQLVREGRIEEVPGVGEAIGKKITELVTTGKLEPYEKLKAEFPEGISTLLDIPGVGPRTALLLTSELGIRSVDELEKAILEGKVAHLYRMGDRTAENILHQIEAVRRKERRIPLGAALPVVDDIIARLKDVPGLKNLTPAGSLRRFKETVGDIDIMGTAGDAKPAIDAFISLPIVKEVAANGITKASVVVSGGLQVDLRIVDHESFGSTLQYFTGSKQHNIDLRERARRLGMSLSEYGITVLKTGKLEKFATEEAFYRRQGLAYIPPEIREGRFEIAAAEKDTLPELVDIADIRGDLHVHSNWSDGHATIEEMSLAARELGYQYIAITDHSVGRGIARGLNEERLLQQLAEIKKLDRAPDGFHIFTGIEVDIRADGGLDFPDELLAQLDVVAAAIHSAMGQPDAQMTRRIINAMENPHVDIFVHPTARLLPERDPVELDMEAIFHAALSTGTALEINAMPSRLDLKDLHVYRARELGVKLVVSTDSHAPEHLKMMRFGIGTARRGWCEAKDIVNSRQVGEIPGLMKPRV